MTIQSVLCVFGGSPEEINALHSVLAFSRLNGTNPRLLHIPAEPQAFADTNDENLEDPDFLMAKLNALIDAADPILAPVATRQKPQKEDDDLDEEEEDDDSNGKKDGAESETQDEDEEEEEELEETYERDADLRQAMADSIVDSITENGVCRLSDLEADGFIAEDIVRCWGPAKQLAEMELAGIKNADEESEANDIAAASMILS